MPQVHGAARDALDYVARTIAVEMNAATDNPMVFAETGELLSGGNFHGEPVAIACDVLAIAAAELGSISERRTERLVNPALSGLPAFLTRKGGVESGLMIAQVVAAALASESKTLCHPASVDSIPTSANKEDHVSMGVTAARKAARVVANTRRILAVELLAACQALDLLLPLRTSPALEAARARCAPATSPPARTTACSPPRSRPWPASWKTGRWWTRRKRFAVGFSSHARPSPHRHRRRPPARAVLRLPGGGGARPGHRGRSPRGGAAGRHVARLLRHPRALRRRKAAPRSRPGRDAARGARRARSGYDLAKDKTTDGQRWLM